MSKENPVKTILISQPAPAKESNPFLPLTEKFKVTVDFIPFIHVEEVTGKDFRKQKITIKDYTAIVFISKISVDHFFRHCQENKIEMPAETKYFCENEQIAVYLQKYIQMRKRKVFFGNTSLDDLKPYFIKNIAEKFLMPIPERNFNDYSKKLIEIGINVDLAIMFRTVYSDLSHLSDVKFDVLVFYSPLGIESLFHNFPDFVQGNTRIATMGLNTKSTAEEMGLIVNILAPTPEAPSMTMALNNYILKANK